MFKNQQLQQIMPHALPVWAKPAKPRRSQPPVAAGCMEMQPGLFSYSGRQGGGVCHLFPRAGKEVETAFGKETGKRGRVCTF